MLLALWCINLLNLTILLLIFTLFWCTFYRFGAFMLRFLACWLVSCDFALFFDSFVHQFCVVITAFMHFYTLTLLILSCSLHLLTQICLVLHVFVFFLHQFLAFYHGFSACFVTFLLYLCIKWLPFALLLFCFDSFC